ncbi:RagB/SusD family nutrient uptake outer membrane protein [Robertkochia solimangrovi]|uniref:RagB/SusD family nutrient uptake outer membrane protein n=1 Tax=Robertkochia solimangrovi TaxID=2213046 RepID=UPI00117E671D|nr:RagB/SusD family nutrient uptake outer membrane protein [Robertkochia solimangrovi]TRZ45038.1 RagB/SusD family nutrient uptake outer membrane protein [Robertkochia solimangrovi]
MKLGKRISIIWIAASLFTLSACTDLSENLYSTLSEDNIDFTSEQDISRLTGYVYNELRYVYWGWNGYFDIMEESSDLLMTPLRVGVGWGDLYISMHKHDFNPYIDHFWTIWNYSYAGIGYANKLLDIEQIQENPFQSAKIRTMRALYYYILFDCFRNIPLEKTQEVEAGYLPSQADPQEVFDFIVSELQAVKEDLGEDKVYGHPNKFVAEMILAKMYLNHNAWFPDSSSNEYYELALTEVSDIIDNGGYSLAANYKDNFLADLSTNPEIIYGIPLDYTYASHNYLVNKALIGEGAKAFGYSGTPWNGSAAIPQFIDTYHQNDLRLDDTWANGQQYHYSTGEKLTTNADDQGNVDLVYTKRVHSIDNPGAYMLEGYRFIKNEIVEGVDGTYGDDVPFFRLADAMFIKAECLLRLGRNQAEAADLISQVRMRSFESSSDATRSVADLTGGSVYDYGHREYTNEGATNYDPAALVATYEGGNDIAFGGLLDDLAWEFVGEHHRRQDLIRFKTGSGLNVYNGKSWFCKDAISDPQLAEEHNIFPIYQDFIDSNINMEQNPGY